MEEERFPDLSKFGFCEYTFKRTDFRKVQDCLLKHKETVFTHTFPNDDEETFFFPWRSKAISQPLCDDLFDLPPTSLAGSCECKPEGYVCVLNKEKTSFIGTNLSVEEYQYLKNKKK